MRDEVLSVSLPSIHLPSSLPPLVAPFFSHFRWGAKFDHDLPAVWAQFFVYEHGLRDRNNCQRAPVACRLAAQLGSGGLVLGDAKYSLLAPGAQVGCVCVRERNCLESENTGLSAVVPSMLPHVY